MYLRVLITLITFCSTQEVFAQMYLQERSDISQNWTCVNDASGMAFNLSALSGYWYEAARVPNQNVLECLNVSVADNITEKNELNLDLKYISTVNNQWLFSEETVTFPWNNNTQNGIFELTYDGDFINVQVTYKLVTTDYTQFALVCGFATISPIPLFKLFIRQRQLSPEVLTYVQNLIEKMAPGMSSQIAWTEQSPDKCNGGMRHEAIPLISLLVTMFVLIWHKVK